VIIILMFSVMVLLALVMCSGDAESQERDLLGAPVVGQWDGEMPASP